MARRLERRGAVRIPARLAMEIVVGGDKARVESVNVSASGVYFSSPVHIPVLTRLRVVLDIPPTSGRQRRGVACDGVVVRTEPENEDASAGEYLVACFFTSIADRDREALESYILKHVPF